MMPAHGRAEIHDYEDVPAFGSSAGVGWGIRFLPDMVLWLGVPGLNNGSARAVDFLCHCIDNDPLWIGSALASGQIGIKTRGQKVSRCGKMVSNYGKIQKWIITHKPCDNKQ
jgi:hypothetical protein